MNRGAVVGRVDSSARSASRGLPTIPQSSALPVSAAPRTGSRTHPVTGIATRAENRVHRALHSCPHKCGPSCGRRRCLRHRAERGCHLQCRHIPPAQSPRRLHPAGFSGGDFPSVNAPRSGSLLRRSRFAVTPDRSPLQVSSRRTPVMHSRALSATSADRLLPERVDALGNRDYRVETAGVSSPAVLWRIRRFTTSSQFDCSRCTGASRGSEPLAGLSADRDVAEQRTVKQGN